MTAAADAYLVKARAEMRGIATAAQLRVWWDRSAKDRTDAGVVGGTPAHDELSAEHMALGRRLSARTMFTVLRNGKVCDV